MKKKSVLSRPALAGRHPRRRLLLESLERRYVLDNAYIPLWNRALAVDWSATNLIKTANEWVEVTGVIGYNGAGLTTDTGTDPQTIVDFGGTPLVTPNIATVSNSGSGIREFETSNPVVAFKAASAAPAPFLLFHVSTETLTSVRVQYNLRDLESGNARVQPFALQYRIGESGPFTNVPEGFVADATGDGMPVTAVDVTLPAEVLNQSQLQIRIINADAPSTDEWVGIADMVESAKVMAIGLDVLLRGVRHN